MELVPYLIFNGNCDEAFGFYERVLGGKIAFKQTFGETPAKDHVPAALHDKVIHVSLEVPGGKLFGSDAPPDQYEPAQGTSVAIGVDTAEEGERIFNALADGGKVTMPFGKTFWSSGFGMVVDKYGMPWMVSAAHKP